MTEPPQNPPPGPPPPDWGPPPPGWGAPPPGYQPMPYGPPGYYAPATEGKAVGALVSAILAFVVCPVIPAIVALILAGQAQQAIAASGGRLQGSGMVTAAKVLAWVNLAFGLLFLLIFSAVYTG